MTSWIMQLWLKTHYESEWPDLSICQGDDAAHVLDAAKHPSDQSIERMCSEDFFAKHGYRYKERSVDGDSDNETYVYASCPSRSRLEETRALTTYQECQEPNSSQSTEAQVASDEGESGYSLPFEETTDKSYGTRLRRDIENQTRTAFYRDVDDAGCKRSHNEIYEAGNSQKTSQHQTSPEMKGKNCNVEYANLDCIYQPNSPEYDMPRCLPKDGACFGKDQTMMWSSDQDDRPAGTTYVRCHGIYQNNPCKMDKSDGTRLCSDNEHQTRTACYRAVNVSGGVRSHHEICEAENSQRTSQQQTSAEIKGTNCNAEYVNLDFKYETNSPEYDKSACLQKICNSDQGDCTTYDKPAGNYQNIPCKMDQANIPKGRERQHMSTFGRSEELGYLEQGGDQAFPFRRLKTVRRRKAQCFQYKKQAKWQHENKENVYENTTSRPQCVPQSEPVYANMGTEGETRHSSYGASLEEEENLVHEEEVGESSSSHSYNAGVERHNSVLKDLFSPVEVDFDEQPI